MIQGYEQPVAMPSLGVFDTDLAKMYIAGIKQQYEQALEDEANFMKTYGDFMSDVEGANEEYAKETTDKVNNVINQLYVRGIDPLRSAVGRAVISRTINNVNTSKLNDLRQQAKDYEAYQNMRREMVAKGLTTDDFEDWNLRQLELDDFTALDPDKKVRRWTRLAPSQLKSISDLTDNIYNKLVANTPVGVTPDGKYDVLSVSNKDRVVARMSALNAIKQDPAYEYYKERAGGSDEALGDLIEQTNAKYLQDKISDSKEYAANLSLRNQKSFELYKDMLEHPEKYDENGNVSEEYKTLALSKLRGNAPQRSPGFVANTIAFSNNKFNKLNSNPIAGLTAISKAFGELYTLLKPGQSYRLGNGERITYENVQKIKNKYDDLITKINNAKTQKDYEDVLSVMKKMKIVDEQGQLNERYYTRLRNAAAISGASVGNVSANGVVSLSNTLNNASAHNYYSNFSLTPPVGKFGDALFSMFAAGNVSNDKTGDPYGLTTFNFRKGDWNIASIREANVVGMPNAKGMVAKLQRYLKRSGKAKGFVRGQQDITSYAAIPNENGSSDIDITGTVYVENSTIKNFFKEEYNLDWDNKDDRKKITSHLKQSGFGIQTMTLPRQYKYKDKLGNDQYKTKNENISFWTIPIIKTQDPMSMDTSVLDYLMDEIRLGDSGAHNVESEREIDARIQAGF